MERGSEVVDEGERRAPWDDLAAVEPAPADRLHVLVVVGHPRASSLCRALADAYGEGARRAGTVVRTIRLHDLAFDPDVRAGHIGDQPLEPDLAEAQRLILWADHLAIVFPTWWGVMPARLKGFLDRVLTPGFAFAETTGGIGYQGHLGGRTADLLVTMDTPALAHRLAYRAPALNAMKRAILGFCGIDTVRVRVFDRVRERDPAERMAWLADARSLGARLENGPRGFLKGIGHTLGPWVRIARLQFYPMTWLAFLLGAVVADAPGFDLPNVVLGLIFLIALEFATVLINESIDLESDRRNAFWGPFTGGSRVLVEGLLRPGAVRIALATSLMLAAIAGIAAIERATEPDVAALVLTAMATLALGYTVPPVRLAWRTLGEATVALTHGIGAVLTGVVIQGGSLAAPTPWVIGLALSLAIMPSITLAGVPDRDADGAVGKKTLAVRFGVSGAVAIATAATVLAATLALVAAAPLLTGIGWFALPHAALLLWRLHAMRPWPDRPRRIDGLLVIALTYMTWFVLVPLVNLARH